MPHSTSRVFYIILYSWDQMYVGMEYFLPSDLTTVPADVESFDGNVFALNLRFVGV